ncbi:hypothetical protein JCM19239_3709 [Vibrio variabilis]|uniref:Uncharacterized protein n=1 Tax=Vibrio variabilis TaxID=990271 RepID=A0ABQ0J9J1_9VIBR|nr:hypothetical protein JCM19239_3709 [Vibrio variabilis]
MFFSSHSKKVKCCRHNGKKDAFGDVWSAENILDEFDQPFIKKY